MNTPNPPPGYATDQDTKLNKTTLNVWYCNLEIQDRDIWQDVVSTVMNVWVPYNAGNFFYWLKNSRVGLCCMDLVGNIEAWNKRNLANVDIVIRTELYVLRSSFAIMVCCCK